MLFHRKQQYQKVRLLLHFYEADRFLGQTLLTVGLRKKSDECGEHDELDRLVHTVYPGTAYNLKIGMKPLHPPVPMLLPSLKEGYGPNTYVKVMQVLRF